MTSGIISGFSSISTTVNNDTADISVSKITSVAEAMDAVTQLYDISNQDGTSILRALDAHADEAVPHHIAVSDDHLPLLESAVASFMTVDDMIVIDPTMTINSGTKRVVCYGDTLYNTTCPIQFINERTYLQMNGTYVMELISPAGASMYTKNINGITFNAFSANSFHIPSRSGEYTAAFYVDVPENVNISVSIYGVDAIDTKLGNHLSSSQVGYIRRITGTIYGVYLFSAGIGNVDIPITVSLTDNSVPSIIGLRTYDGHAIMDGVRSIRDLTSHTTISLPTGDVALEDPGYTIGISYMLGRSGYGTWLSIGSMCTIETSNGQKMVTITDGDIISQESFPYKTCEHDVSLLTCTPTKLLWEDTNGNSLGIVCSRPIVIPQSITISPINGYIGGIVCSSYAQIETIQSHLMKKG